MPAYVKRMYERRRDDGDGTCPHQPLTVCSFSHGGKNGWPSGYITHMGRLDRWDRHNQAAMEYDRGRWGGETMPAYWPGHRPGALFGAGFILLFLVSMARRALEGGWLSRGLGLVALVICTFFFVTAWREWRRRRQWMANWHEQQARTPGPSSEGSRT